jgi:hypothetical protein
MVQLRYNPFLIFRNSASPYALHVRRKILESENGSDLAASKKILQRILKGQSRDGSWKSSVIQTVKSLFEIELLEDGPLEAGGRAVEWLMQNPLSKDNSKSKLAEIYQGLFFWIPRPEEHTLPDRRDLLFNRGCSGFFKTGATLYFSGVFGLERDPRIKRAFRTLDNVLKQRDGKWCSLYCSNNILRAYVSHPLRRGHASTRTAVKYLEKNQKPDGSWPDNSYFYYTFHILAQSRLQSARKQIKKALPRVYRSQNRDGTWGRKGKEFTTFLVVDSLYKQGLIS